MWKCYSCLYHLGFPLTPTWTRRHPTSTRALICSVSYSISNLKNLLLILSFSLMADVNTQPAITSPSTVVHSQSYTQKMSTNGTGIKHADQPHQQHQQHPQPSSYSSGQYAGSSTAASKSNFNSVGEIGTGVMLAGCVSSWGWGYGLGWQEPVKHLISNYILLTYQQ